MRVEPERQCVDAVRSHALRHGAGPDHPVAVAARIPRLAECVHERLLEVRRCRVVARKELVEEEGEDLVRPPPLRDQDVRDGPTRVPFEGGVEVPHQLLSEP